MATGASQKKGTSARGFASMSPEQQRAIARKGGKAVSQNRAHMAAIGRKGGEATHARHSRAKTQEHSTDTQKASQETTHHSAQNEADLGEFNQLNHDHDQNNIEKDKAS